MRALVVDDSRAMRVIVSRVLRQLGFEVIEAGDGREALDLLQAVGVDVAMVDWNMPEMDGIEFVRLVRSEGRFDRLKLLMITGETDDSAAASALDAGADGYLQKPFTREGMLQKLNLIGLNPAA